MIRCTLKALLKERNKPLRQLSRETGIRLYTLSQLQNDAKQFVSVEVMDKLCTAMAITPGELFIYEAPKLPRKDVEE